MAGVEGDELKKKEQALASARDFAENIVDTVREGLLVLDEGLRVRSANLAFCRLFGLSRDQALGRPLAELGTGEWSDPTLTRALQTTREGQGFDGFRFDREFPRIGRRLLLLNARRLAAAGERAGWLLLAIENITDAIRSEEVLREMLLIAAHPIVMSDADGRIVLANPAAHRAYGYDAGELLGVPIELLVPERLRSQHEAHRAKFNASTAAQMGRPGMDLVGRRKDGTEFPVEVGLAPVVGSRGALVAAFVTDVSERRKSDAKILEYQEKLRRLAFDWALAEERERRRIAAHLHDGVGQTLALTQNKLAATRSAPPDSIPATIDECVRLIEESIAQTRSLTFDLSPPILYDLGLEPALRWLAEQMGQRYGLHVEVEGDTDLKMDPEVAAIVFRSVRELLTNVSKHAHVSAAKVTLAQMPEKVAVTVEDIGAGFDASPGESGPARASGSSAWASRSRDCGDRWRSSPCLARGRASA